MTATPNEALATIRKAYRYIEQYQQRVLDAMRTLDGRLAQKQFRFWQCLTTNSFHCRHPFEQSGGSALPLLDFEIAWSHGAKEEVDKGLGTYAVVRHVADTSRTPRGRAEDGIGIAGDSVLHALLVRPAGRFRKDHFSKDWAGCVAAHFELVDAAEFRNLQPRGPLQSSQTESGAWYLHVLSLASITKAEDFMAAFVEPLVARAATLAGIS